MAYAYVGPVAHDSGTGNLPIHRIVVHCTAGGSDEGSARGTAKYFQQAAATGSAHAITDANELVICAFDNVICWHAPPNSHSLGIEIECSLANGGKGHWTLDSHQKKMRRAAKWVAEKCKLYDIPIRKLTVAQLKANSAVEGICGHVDVSLAFGQSSHTDPGPYFPWSQFIGYVQAEFDALTEPPTPPPPTSGDWLDMATLAEVQKAAYAANSKYALDFWVAPSGTGTGIRKDITDIETGLGALSVKLDALIAGQTEQTAALARLAAGVEALGPKP